MVKSYLDLKLNILGCIIYSFLERKPMRVIYFANVAIRICKFMPIGSTRVKD